MNFLKEQNNAMITLTGTVDPLPIQEVWKRSSAVFWIESAFPCQAMQLKIGAEDKSKYKVSITALYHPKRGLWRVYIPGKYFTAKCETYYKIVGVDEYGNRSVCGEGLLRIREGKIYDFEDESITTDECFAFFPDGKWRKVSVSTDNTGELVFVVEQNGIPPIEFEHEPAKPYALNKATGLHYEVSGFVDESGEAYLCVAADGVQGKDDAFAKDDATGFYYRVESFADEVGEPSLKVGDRK